MAYVLLVTWFAYSQPPNSYQTIFDTEKACILARSAVLAEAERMKAEREGAAAAHGGFVPAMAGDFLNVSATCTPKG
jgi:hypothetical protein